MLALRSSLGPVLVVSAFLTGCFQGSGRLETRSFALEGFEAVDASRYVDLEVVRGHILEAPGVAGVHDLHAWTITSGMNVVSAHVVLEEDAKTGDILDHLGMCLSDDFDIKHSTFQLETPEHVEWEARGKQAQV